MEKPFKDFETLFFCDEGKFYLNNGDFEDAFFYFAIPVQKSKVKLIHDELNIIYANNRLKSNKFHATEIFRGNRDRSRLIGDITNLIVRNKLLCICFKYPKNVVFEKTKALDYLNDGDIMKFHNSEFQALFYFLILLNTYLVEDTSLKLQAPYAMYFDRNVYGNRETEAFVFPNDNFIIKRMTFCESSEISLLALPDFFGYIFRQTKNYQNKIDAGVVADFTPLIDACQQSLVSIHEAGLFFLIHLQDHLPNLGKALNINFDAHLE